MNIAENLATLRKEIPSRVTLVAVSKTHPVEAIKEAYDTGQKVFGENKVQELIQKQPLLPKDIEWHLIGHLQTNKVKYIVPFVALIHSVDSLKLLTEINKEAAKINRVVDCLLQMHIASEDTKFGLSTDEIIDILESSEYRAMKNIRLKGLMGMATFTDDAGQVLNEFNNLKQCFEMVKTKYMAGNSNFKELSMGMSGDYMLAIESGSTMVRIGSLIFGERNYNLK